MRLSFVPLSAPAGAPGLSAFVFAVSTASLTTGLSLTASTSESCAVGSACACATAGAAAAPATTSAASRRNRLFFPAIKGDIVEVRVCPAHGGAEGDRVDGLQIHVRGFLSEAALAELRPRQRVELPVGRELDGGRPAVLAAIVAAGWRLILSGVVAELTALVGRWERVARASLVVEVTVLIRARARARARTAEREHEIELRGDRDLRRLHRGELPRRGIEAPIDRLPVHVGLSRRAWRSAQAHRVALADAPTERLVLAREAAARELVGEDHERLVLAIGPATRPERDAVVLRHVEEVVRLQVRRGHELPRVVLRGNPRRRKTHAVEGRVRGDGRRAEVHAGRTGIRRRGAVAAHGIGQGVADAAAPLAKEAALEVQDPVVGLPVARRPGEPVGRQPPRRVEALHAPGAEPRVPGRVTRRVEGELREIVVR